MTISKKPYEISYLVRDTLTEEQAQTLHQTIKAFVSDLGGVIQKETAPRKRRLAYDIKKQKNAYFVNFYFELGEEKIKELDKKLRFEKEVLRYLIIAVDRKQTREATKVRFAGRDKFKKIGKKESPEDATKLEELDKKLEEILKKI